MASKRRLRRRSCANKKQYTRGDAIKAAKQRRAKGVWIHAYHCAFGDHWHIGHPTKQAKATIRSRIRDGEETDVDTT